MPNDCTNNITITCKNEESLNNFIRNKLQHNNNGSYEYYETITIIKKCQRAMIFDMWSAWHPNYQWLESILDEYPDIWIKNLWKEEGGDAGVWVGYVEYNKPIINKLIWRDLSIEDEYYLLNDNNS